MPYKPNSNSGVPMKMVHVPKTARFWQPEERRVNGELVNLYPFRLHVTEKQMKGLSRLAKNQQIREGELVKTAFDRTIKQLLSGKEGQAFEADLTEDEINTLFASSKKELPHTILTHIQDELACHKVPSILKGGAPGALYQRIRRANLKGKTLFTHDELGPVGNDSTLVRAFEYTKKTHQIRSQKVRAGAAREGIEPLYRAVANPSVKTIIQKNVSKRG